MWSGKTILNNDISQKHCLILMIYTPALIFNFKSTSLHVQPSEMKNVFKDKK